MAVAFCSQFFFFCFRGLLFFAPVFIFGTCFVLDSFFCLVLRTPRPLVPVRPPPNHVSFFPPVFYPPVVCCSFSLCSCLFPVLLPLPRLLPSPFSFQSLVLCFSLLLPFPFLVPFYFLIFSFPLSCSRPLVHFLCTSFLFPFPPARGSSAS